MRPIKAVLADEEFLALDGDEDDEDDEEEEFEEKAELESPSILNRLRRSIDGIFGSASDKLDGDADKHLEKAHRRKGKGKPKGDRKGKKGKGRGDAIRKHKNGMEERRRKVEKKVRNEKRLAALEVKQKSRIRRQPVVSSDDEDLAEASGSGALDPTNRQCELTVLLELFSDLLTLVSFPVRLIFIIGEPWNPQWAKRESTDFKEMSQDVAAAVEEEYEKNADGDNKILAQVVHFQ